MITEGILNINKPQNMTSHDVVSVIRRTLSIRRVGHTGTLDPMATGVLPVCVGKSTRIMEYLDMDLKTYVCSMVLGIQTDTQDIWGKIVDRGPVDVTNEDIHRAFAGFDGVIDQKPPMYSALKVDGKRLYEYAREGKTVDVKTRKVFLKDLQILDISKGFEGLPQITFSVTCSKGTYIRTICQDVGIALGTYGTMTQLQRIASGVFHAEKAVELDTFSNMEMHEIEKLLVPSWYPLCAFGRIVCGEEAGLRFASGWHLPLNQCRIERKPLYEESNFVLPMREEFRHAYCVFCEINGREEFLGVAFYNYQYRKLVADKVFFTR
ncbi:tRNA pseudouridine(55) synthase TruB [Ihubacter sp. mB4P-1]|uniref:tRNA pseudouridine(55) synthase TruB n=1 Tax=Ihubacter sp. mB4P-1 TaxID=3242370 RepID=UPI00137961D4